MTTTFKLVIVGDGGVGKTTFINRHTTGDFIKVYHPTLGVKTSKMNFQTDVGNVCFNVFDLAGQEKFSESVPDLKDADCAIIMFDVTSQVSYKNVVNWYDTITNACGNIPTVVCGNKVDIRERKVMPRDIDMNFNRTNNIMYYDVSAKSNYNFEKPFLSLIKDLIGATRFVSE